MAEQKPSQEEALKESLLDVVAIAKVLQPFCHTVEELVDMVELATTNSGQFRLILKLTKETGNKR